MGHAAGRRRPHNVHAVPGACVVKIAERPFCDSADCHPLGKGNRKGIWNILSSIGFCYVGRIEDSLHYHRGKAVGNRNAPGWNHLIAGENTLVKYKVIGSRDPCERSHRSLTDRYIKTVRGSSQVRFFNILELPVCGKNKMFGSRTENGLIRRRTRYNADKVYKTIRFGIRVETGGGNKGEHTIHRHLALDVPRVRLHVPDVIADLPCLVYPYRIPDRRFDTVIKGSYTQTHPVGIQFNR